MSSMLSMDSHSASAVAPTQHAKNPIVTGTSVLGIKYAGGVLLAADTLCSYGSMAKYKSAERLRVVSPGTIIGAGGEYSDFQYLIDDLKKKSQAELNEDDGGALDAQGYWNYLRAVMYQVSGEEGEGVRQRSVSASTSGGYCAAVMVPQ